MVSKKVWVILLEVFFSLPTGLFLGVVTPLNLAELDNLGTSDSVLGVKNFNRLLFVCQVTFQLNFFQWYCRRKVTADVRRAGLIMRPLLRGGIEERVDIDRRLGDLPRIRPLFVSR